MDLKGAAMAVLISLLWGANTVVIKMGLEDAPPLRLAWMRFVVGGVVICLWAWATGRFAGFRIEPSSSEVIMFLHNMMSVQEREAILRYGYTSMTSILKRRRAVVQELMQFHGLNPPDEALAGG